MFTIKLNGQLQYYITSLSRGQPFRLQGGSHFQPPYKRNVSKMYPKILLFLKGLWPKNRAKTHDIWHSLTRGLDMKLPPYKRKCDPLLNEVMQQQNSLQLCLV
ncbi:Hypothetical_protein [Hexamita inflata]|uniref:Hypothetical_protein n=1 Tax=Hexamita inflata TaxID=28002 RepID=A0AA86UDH2_9EUKA|nr:Hypothetical protein HINF_LOCUS41490 [Hexamita inflata]